MDNFILDSSVALSLSVCVFLHYILATLVNLAFQTELL